MDSERFRINMPIRAKIAKCNSLAALLHPYGVAVNSGIISKTNIAIFGKDAGPKKREQVRELNASGSDIVVVDEAELYAMIDTILQ